jgi:HPt (histidine-containing phosphotransfer) domain-containing protein
MLIPWVARQEPGIAENTATAPASDAEAAFDQAGLLKHMMGDRALAELVAQRFLEDIPSQLSKLRKHLEEGDAASARRQVHTLKGAAATVSANGLRAVAFEAEQAARAGKLKEVAELLPRVEQQAELFKIALLHAEWVQGGGGTGRETCTTGD